MESASQPIGAALSEVGSLSKEDLMAAIRSGVRDAFAEALTPRIGDFDKMAQEAVRKAIADAFVSMFAEDGTNPSVMFFEQVRGGVADAFARLRFA